MNVVFGFIAQLYYFSKLLYFRLPQFLHLGKGDSAVGGLNKFMYGKCPAQSLTGGGSAAHSPAGVVSRSLVRARLCLFQHRSSGSLTPAGALQLSSILTLPTFL